VLPDEKSLSVDRLARGEMIPPLEGSENKKWRDVFPMLLILRRVPAKERGEKRVFTGGFSARKSKAS